MKLCITKHAFKQYCRRVGPTDWIELIQLCQSAYDERRFTRQKQYICLDGVWWIYEQNGDQIFLVTCYGRTSMDLPAAIRWAKQHRDKVNISKTL